MKKTKHSIRAKKATRTAGALLILVGMALLPLLAAGCNRKAEANPSTEQSSVAEVVTTNPRRMDMTRDIEQPGYLRAYEQTPIYTKIAGIAKEPKVDRGDWVKKGDLLVEIYLPEVETELRVREAKVRQAEADVKQAKEQAKAAKAGMDAAFADISAKLASIHSAEAEVKRWRAEVVRSENLLKKGIYDQQTADEQNNQLNASVASQEEATAKWVTAKANYIKASAQYNKSEADVEVADATLEVAKSNRDFQKDWLDYKWIRAPYNGVITSRYVHTGHFLQPNNSGTTTKSAEPLFMMMRTDIMRMTVEVPEIDAGFVRNNDEVRIRFQAKAGEVPEIVAKVTRNSFALDERSRTLTVEIFLDNLEGKLMPGMYANVTILAKLHKVMELPAGAIMNDILADGDRSFCFMVENGKVHKTFLEVGARCDQGVQVVRKMRAGGKWEPITGKEIVVVEPKKPKDGAPTGLVGPGALQDGQQVQVKPLQVAEAKP